MSQLNLLIVVLLLLLTSVFSKINYLNKFLGMCSLVTLGNQQQFELSTVRLLSDKYKADVYLHSSVLANHSITGYFAFAVQEKSQFNIYLRVIDGNDVVTKLLPVYYTNILSFNSSIEIIGSSKSRVVEQGLTIPSKLKYLSVRLPKWNTKVYLFGNYDTIFNESEKLLARPDFFMELNQTLSSGGTAQCFQQGFFNKYNYYGEFFKYIGIYVSLSIDIIVSIVTVVTVFLLRNRKLVKTRSFSPYMTFVTIVCFRLLFTHDYPNNPLGGVYYFSFGTISVTVLICGIVIYALLTIRYFYIRSLYALILKRQSTETDDVLKFHRRLTSNTTILIVVIIVSAVTLIPFTVGYIIFWINYALSLNSDLTNVVTVIEFIVLVLMPVIACTLGSGAFIIEFFLNFHKVRKNGIVWYLVFNDPLLIRLEVFLFTFVTIPFTLACCGISLYLLILGSDYTSSCTPQACATLGHIIRWLIHSFVASPFAWLITFTAGGGFVSVVELVRIVTSSDISGTKDQVEPVNTQEDSEFGALNEVLERPELCTLFEKYCAHEWSIENFRLWKVLNAVKQSGSMTFEEYGKMFNQYIGPLSPMQVNLPSDTVQGLKTILSQQGPVNFSDLKSLFLNIVSSFWIIVIYY
jgi:hypothetical protein